jgi:starch synthase
VDRAREHFQAASGIESLPPDFVDAFQLLAATSLTAAGRPDLGLLFTRVPSSAPSSLRTDAEAVRAIIARVDRERAMPWAQAPAPVADDALAQAAAAHPTRVAFIHGYDEALAHLIEAGADIFLMPSRFEPCGLNQMYSMIYGTPPVVYRTGGLADTVTQVTFDEAGGELEGTGFLFERADSEALLAAVTDALACWRDPSRWRQLQRNGMQQDFSWSTRSRAYLALYRQLLKPARSGESST